MPNIIDRTLTSVRTGDEIYVTNLLLNVDMGGCVLSVTPLRIVINQTPSMYDYLKGTILTSDDFVFKWRKIRLEETLL